MSIFTSPLQVDCLNCKRSGEAVLYRNMDGSMEYRCIYCGRTISVIATSSTPNPVGLKHDQGKIDLTYLEDFELALDAICEVAEFGNKVKGYDRSSWLLVPEGFRRYTAAMLRHWKGEKRQPLDDESKLHHAKHVAWNALARLEIMLREKEKEDESSKNS